MQKRPDDIVDELVVGKRAMAAIVAKDKNGPEHGALKVPIEWSS